MVLDASRRLRITIGLTMAVVMTGLDMTVVNVSLPHMQAGLSASPDQVTWTMTSFIVATAVMTPISGWLAARFGTRAMVLACIAAFTATSLFCGIAQSLPEMVLFRILQGAAGAPLAPLAQSTLFNINPPERQGRAMAAFSMAIMLSPTLGPVIGAFITDTITWRWCFYLNLPVGVVSFLLLATAMPRSEPVRRPFDFLGFSALAVAMASLQLMLDRGSSQDWFQAPEIWIEATLAAIGLWVFVSHSITAKHPLFDRGLARDRNFLLAQLLLFSSMFVLIASGTLVPLLMQTVLNYPILTTGFVLMPRGVILILVIMATGRLDRRLDRQLVIGFAFLMLAASFWRMSHFDLTMSIGMILSATFLQGVGQGALSVPTTTMALSTLSPHQRPDASAVSSTLRNLGASVGLATFQALAIANTQRMHESLTARANLQDPVFASTVPAALSPATLAGAERLNAEITRQAMMVGYLNDFRLMTLYAASVGAALMLARLLQLGLRSLRARRLTPVARAGIMTQP